MIPRAPRAENPHPVFPHPPLWVRVRAPRFPVPYSITTARGNPAKFLGFPHSRARKKRSSGSESQSPMEPSDHFAIPRKYYFCIFPLPDSGILGQNHDNHCKGVGACSHFLFFGPKIPSGPFRPPPAGVGKSRRARTRAELTNSFARASCASFSANKPRTNF